MIHLTDGILLVLEYGFAVFCFVDIVRSPEAAVPWVPRWGWIIAVLVFPVAGAVGWIAAGHQRRLRIRSGKPA
ncbi:MAG TPA: PLDc N-terminal domain-containing protein, partial [Kineosporiaceae bacterium]|nr:PLDc N-terminal domain-containing protein [Kineosporiaceae bacterium]